MRVLIAGGFGFVGGRLAMHLVQAGHQVLLGSRTAICSPDWLPQAEVVHLEWDDAAAIQHSCEGIDVVIQAAGMNAQDCSADPVAALAFNGVATARLVAAASIAGVQRIIYLSTAHVYAGPLVGTITEETCTRNLHPYATSHLAGEYAVLSANQRGKIQGVVLRLSNAFGAPMHQDVNCWGLLANDLCKQAVQTRKLVLQTNGLQQRDFISMTAVCRVVESIAVGKSAPVLLGTFNVGSGASLSVKAMARLIQQRCEKILGFTPLLESTPSVVTCQEQPLVFQIEKLKAIGLDRKGDDSSSEIDNLLRYCQTRFRLSQGPSV